MKAMLENFLRTVGAFLLFFFVTLTFSGKVFAAEKPLDAVVAIANNEVITASQLKEQLAIAKQQILSAGAPMPSADKLRQQALDVLINTSLQLQLAKKANIAVSDDQVNQTIREIAAKNNITAESLQKKVTEEGMSFETYKNEIQKEMTISALQQRELSAVVMVSDQEISDMLLQLKKQPDLGAISPAHQEGTQYHLIDILVPVADNAASSEIQQANKGAIALYNNLQKTKDPSRVLSKDNTLQINDMGWRTLSQLPDLFSKTAITLSPGQFSSPIHAGNGFHLLQLLAVKNAEGSAVNLSPQSTLNSPQTHIQMIFVKKNPLLSDEQMQAHMQLIRNQIHSAHDFVSAAQIYSQEPTSASKGGDIGWISSGVLPVQVEQTIETLKIGELSQPIVTPTGFYLIEVLAKRENKDPQNLLKERARQLVYQRKYAEALQNWLQQLRSQSYVKIND